MNIRDFRPQGPPGRGDRYLREVARDVASTIRSVQREFEYETLRLTPEELSELSLILAGFAEDLHNDIGFWRTYENYNREWFGVPLPITEGSGDVDASVVTADRVRHLLWVLFMVMKPELTLGPMHRDFGRLAEVLEVTNLINDRPYRVMMGSGPQPFRPGSMVFGGLVPWGEYWYWSGAQRQYPAMDDAAVQDIRQSMIAKSSSIVYRYRKDLLDQAVAATERHYREFLDYHGGKDLVVYPDGLSMAADEQRRFRQMYEAQSRKTVDRVMAKLGLKNPWPNMTYPEHILNCTTGIGLYYARQQGVEMMTGFNDVLEGFAKQGRDLRDDDAEAIRACIMSHSISPSFVRRIVQEHGDASIRAAFLLHDCGKPYATEYLLRRYKGASFRNVYPNISIVD